jgi:thioredoxin reductase (NADPH)
VAYPLVRRALVLGQVDTYLVKPWGTPEERLYPVVSELLSGWARIARPRQALLRIVGEQLAPRSHELKEGMSAIVRRRASPRPSVTVRS